MKHYLLLWIIVPYLPLHGQQHIQDFFSHSDPDGSEIVIEYSLNFDQSGGHIQGIQKYSTGEKDYLLLSGSSERVAYMAFAEYDSTARIIQIDTLMTEPFRHAGGFQIMDHYLAVGIEDNHLRTSSRVIIYDLTQVGEAPLTPLHSLERNGAYERATAGAVGLCQMGRYVVLVVANWDARHTDWYITPTEGFENGEIHFQKIASLEMAKLDKGSWSDPEWASYQNINLFTGPDPDDLFLVGLTTSGGQNIADLYRVDVSNSIRTYLTQTMDPAHPPIQIVKLQRRTYDAVGNTSFRYGAGLYRSPQGTWEIFSCPEHMSVHSVLGRY